MLGETAAHLLSTTALEQEVQVLVVSENGPRRTIPGFKPLSWDDRFRQLVIYGRDELVARRVPQRSTNRLLIARVDLSNVVFGVYLPPDLKHEDRVVALRSFRLELQSLDQQRMSYILAGDLNCHDASIGINHTVEEAYYRNFTARHNLLLLSNGMPTRAPKRGSA